jgi:dCMP deaminase
MLIEIAFVVARRGTCERAQVGAVISRDGRIISTGYVGAPAGAEHCTSVGCQLGNHNGCIRTIHAEANAIAYAARAGTGTESAELFCTHSPCEPCAKLIISAGIRRVVYATRYRDETGVNLLESVGIEVRQWS